jgi:hypothetical protein
VCLVRILLDRRWQHYSVAAEKRHLLRSVDAVERENPLDTISATASLAHWPARAAVLQLAAAESYRRAINYLLI